jgi:hypothetical protein
MRYPLVAVISKPGLAGAVSSPLESAPHMPNTPAEAMTNSVTIRIRDESMEDGPQSANWRILGAVDTIDVESPWNQGSD